MNGIDQFFALPAGLRAFIGALVIVQLTLAVWALIRLAKTPRTRMGGISRPAWIAIIALGQCVGPIAFLVISSREAKDRKQGSVYCSPKENPEISSVIAQLYGESQ